MPPAAVKGDGEIGVAPAGHRGDPVGSHVEAAAIEPEMPGLAALGRGKNNRAALAHRRGAQQRRSTRRFLTHPAHGP